MENLLPPLRQQRESQVTVVIWDTNTAHSYIRGDVHDLTDSLSIHAPVPQKSSFPVQNILRRRRTHIFL